MDSKPTYERPSMCAARPHSDEEIIHRCRSLNREFGEFCDLYTVMRHVLEVEEAIRYSYSTGQKGDKYDTRT